MGSQATNNLRALVIRIPYLPAQVWVRLGKRGRDYTVSLMPNGSAKGIGYSRNSAFAQRLVTAARRQMRSDAYYTTLAALGGEPYIPPLAGTVRYSVELRWDRPGKLPDEDGVIASLKACLDGIADGLGVDDRVFRLAGATVTRAEQGETEIRIGGTA